MQKWLSSFLLIIILLLAATLRLTGIDWDEYHHYHPDERYITWVATSIEWPTDWQTAFTPDKSSFNLYYWPENAESAGILMPQDEPRKFAYGHFPLYLGVAATRLVDRIGPVVGPLLPSDWLLTQDILNEANWIEFRHLTAVTRALTALFDVCVVYLVFLLGKRLFNVSTGLVAAAFLAVNVMHIQLAHFFTFDTYMTFFVLLAILLMVVSFQTKIADSVNGTPSKKSIFLFMLAAVSIGLAVGSKFSAILLFLPLVFTIWLVKPTRWLAWVGTAVFVSFIAFFFTNPFAVLDFSCEVLTPAFQLGRVRLPVLDWRSCYLDNIMTQNGMVQGTSDLPFTRQYMGTLPYLYFIEMQLRWGMGLLLGVVAFVGFGWVVWIGGRDLVLFVRRRRGNSQQSTVNNQQSTVKNRQLSIVNCQLSIVIVLVWCVPFFLVTGNFYVKFMRYLQPLTPFLMIFGAALLVQLPWRRMRWVMGTAVFIFTALYAFSFVNLYSLAHPWTVASNWIYATVPSDSLILSEQWDDSLPTSLFFDGEFRSRSEYENEELTWLTKSGDRDDEAKLGENLDRLARADYVVITSNRVYGVVPRLAEKFPISSQYHQLLFDGSLGYEPVFVVDRTPHLFGVDVQADYFGGSNLQPPTRVADYLAGKVALNWGRVDESFTVYDQPLTVVFENNGRLSSAEMRQQFVP